jgi:hypothetical protein
MSQTIAVPTRATAPTSAPRAGVRRSDADGRFYLIAASAMLLFTAVGFRRFFQHGHTTPADAPVTAQIMPLVAAHGIAMFSWVVVFFVQSALVETGRRKLHMVLGPFALLLAGVVVILGAIVAAFSVHFNAAGYKHLGGAKAFLATMWIEMFAFGTFVALGWWWRRKPALHRPMMLLGTLVMQSGALSRCPYLGEIGARTRLNVWVPELLFGALLLVLNWSLSRTVNRALWLGYGVVVLAALLSVGIANTTAWNHLTSSIIP